jgi:hypothetical protein
MADQYFTSPSLARLLVKETLAACACGCARHRVLDPCAGDGALVEAAREAGCAVDAIEIDPALCARFGWQQADFLEGVKPKAGGVQYCAVLCNPPFARSRGQHANRSTNGGTTYGYCFLKHASSFARILGFVLSVYSSNPRQLEKAGSLVSATHHLSRVVPVLDKESSLFRCDAAVRRVPVDIHIYCPGPPVVVAAAAEEAGPAETKDFEVLRVNDPEVNLIVKRWGSLNRIGRVVESEKERMRAFVEKKRRSYGYDQGANYHLRCRDPAKVARILKAAEPLFDDHFSWVAGRLTMECITPRDFIGIYCKAKRALCTRDTQPLPL